MSYLVQITGRRNIKLYLVDRRKTKKQWWTDDPDDYCVMRFKKEQAAQNQANKLQFKNPEVVEDDSFEVQEAKKDNFDKQVLDSFHPFEGLNDEDYKNH